jgi:hypothetical protein
MDSGALEIELQVDQNSTAIVFTPDLSIRLAASGVYHFAVGVTGQGDTCFKPLPGNAAGIVVSELMGSDEYGVVADQGALFPGGKPSARTSLTSDCGCPVPPPVLRAEATAPPSPSSSAASATSPAKGAGSAASSASTDPEPQPSVERVEVPFVFSANAPPAPARVQFSMLPNLFLTQEDVDPAVLPKKEAVPAVEQSQPVSAAITGDNLGKKEKNKGFLARLKGFFTGLFHR